MHALIIAEAGVNHNGEIKIAQEMVDVAQKAGADIVKFQTSITSTSKFSVKAPYQIKTTGESESQLDMLKKLRLSFDEHRMIKSYCDSIGITYLSTPFDFESIDFLAELNIPFWKVPSGEIINIPYLEKIGQTRKNVVLSTGMATLNEIEDALDILAKNGCPKITLLQCTTEYPTPPERVNLRAMLELKKRFGLDVGISDHTVGIEVPIAAVALGATVIEKHFTLDRNMAGPDHKASLEPEELFNLVKGVRKIELAMGDGIKQPTPEEINNVPAARKSIVAMKKIKKNEMFTVDNIVPRHAAGGISPKFWYEVLGKIAIRDFEEDEMIEL